MHRSIIVIALALSACTAQVSSIDPEPCRAIIAGGGEAKAYTACLLSRAKSRNVGGMPVLSEGARSALESDPNDPCRSEPYLTTADFLACEMARPTKPIRAAAPGTSAAEAPPLPLAVTPGD